ncbi:hypothetical protein [Telmatospirillum sp.]|uniref:hypothetical protein n=1 Tax=Telmatospirillum sp. TaxID=2079197 RepID=UPI00284B9BF5|nr:hypothetical protein [Telmatospirillum sp.]MDR3441065.1 hypothetical protein [Telmatospirillum sp.]
MFLRSAIVAAFCLACIAGTLPADAASKAKEGEAAGSTEIKAKLTSSYVAVPALHLPVQVDANRNYRALDLEVWLLQADPEKRQVLNSKKKLIAEQMRIDFSSYNWEAFEDSKGGPEVVKRIVTTSVERATGTPVEDVMIKTLVLK